MWNFSNRLLRNWFNRWRGKQNPHNDFSRWEQDYVLQDFIHMGLFYEYLEMGERLMVGRQRHLFRTYLRLTEGKFVYSTSLLS